MTDADSQPPAAHVVHQPVPSHDGDGLVQAHEGPELCKFNPVHRGLLFPTV